MTRYVWDKASSQFVERKTKEPMQVRSGICMPMVMRDIPEYRSPIDGKPITSRSHRREDLARNGCIELDPPKPRGFKNKRFAKKHNLPI